MGVFLAGLDPAEAKEKPYIASMGIYVFRKELMVKLLKDTYPKSNDFGGEIIPAAAKDHKVVAYLFNDYWEDIGTIKSFFEANLALAQQVARIMTLALCIVATCTALLPHLLCHPGPDRLLRMCR